MAFDIGERVESRFMGKGRIVSDLFKDEEGEVYQQVQWDSGLMRHWPVRKMSPVVDGSDVSDA